jgi:hypothetical protein
VVDASVLIEKSRPSAQDEADMVMSKAIVTILDAMTDDLVHAASIMALAVAGHAKREGAIETKEDKTEFIRTWMRMLAYAIRAVEADPNASR